MARFSGGTGGGEAGPPGADANTGDITFDGVKIIGAGTASGDGSNNSTMQLVPDPDLYGTDQYLIIDPTNPNHIHIRAGGTQDESNADLILGGERNNVYIEDDARNVSISTRPATVVNTYTNLNPTGNTSFVVSNTANIYVGDTAVYAEGGLIITVDSVTADSPEAGLQTITANLDGTPAIFVGGAAHIFTHEETWNNSWQFRSDGVLLGPAMGSLAVNGIFNNFNDSLYINSSEGVIIDSVGGEFLHDDNSPENQIATIGDVENISIDRISSGEFEAIIDETGTTTFDGNIVPSAATYSLGTAALPWQDIYVSAGSINIADNDMETDSVSIKNTEGYLVLSRGGLKVTDNTNEFEVFQLNPDGTLVLKSTVVEGTQNAALEIIGSLNGTSIDPGNTGVLLHLTGLRDSPSRIYNDSYGTGVYSAYIGRHARGTSEDPEGLIAGDIISRIGGNAFLSSGQFAPISNVRMDFVAKENQTATARGNEVQFWTTEDGETTPTRSFTLENTGITFPDNTKQTTAAVAQIQSDWTQADNTELDYIKNKPTLPDLSGYGVPTVYSPVWSGTGLAYTGTPATGSYIKMGKMVTFRVKVLMTTVTNFGTGDYSLTLPFAPVANYAFRDGGLHDGGNHYSIMLDADPSNTTGRMYYNTSNGLDARFNHNSPKALSTTDYFYISGTYECV